MSKEFTQKMMNMVYDALELYIPTDPKNFKPELFSRENKEIVDVGAIVGNQGTEEDRSDFFKKIEEHRLTKDGLWYYGVKFSYNPKTKIINARDVHVCEVSVIDDRNKPIAYVSFVPQVRCACSNVQTAKRIIYNPFYNVRAFYLDMFLENMRYVDLEEGKVYDSIRTELVRFSPDSVKNFYSFTSDLNKTKCFVRKTKSMSASFARSGHTDLVRYTVNVSSHSNSWGLTFAVWENYLISNRHGNICLDNDITEDEVEFACSACKGSMFEKEVHRMFNVINDDSNKNQIIQQFTDEKIKLQSIVDAHKDEIFSELLSGVGFSASLPDNEETRKQLHAEAEKFGLDCGSVYFFFKDNEMNENAKNAAVYGALDVFHDGSFSLKLPYETQSITMQRIMADKVVSLAETEGIQLGCKTCLD